MKLVLIDEWHEVLTKAWSVRFGALSAFFYLVNLLSDIGGFIGFFQEYIPKVTFLVLAGLCAIAGFASRFIKQDALHG